MMRISSAALWALLLALAMMVGCLEFDGQTVYVAHDEAGDRLLLIFEYRNLYDTGEHGDAGEQLRRALDSEIVAFLGSFPFAFPLEEIRTGLKSGEGDYGKVSEPIRRDCLEVLSRIRVLNAGFYRDAADRPCAAQVVVIENVGKTLPLANNTINALLREQLNPASQNRYARIALDAAREDQAWLRLSGNALTLQFPCTEESLQEVRSDLVGQALGEHGPDCSQTLEWLLGQPVQFWQEDDRLRLKVGLKSRPTHLLLAPSRGDYKPNFGDYIDQKYGYRLDEMLVRYIEEPSAPAETKQEMAARMMAPRLSEQSTVRVLTRALRREPSKALWAELAAVRPNVANGRTQDALLDYWEQWLWEQVGTPDQIGAEREE